MQRLFDIFFSGLALMVFSPFLIPVMIVLRFTGEGEIFYIQQRVGKNGDMFGLFKFATMLKDSPSMGTQTITVKGDSRVLPFGKFLRQTKINELPQLLNILIGNMSVIGPRPQTKRCFFAFPKKSQNAIIEVKPGLSGIGSIIFRDEESMLDDNKVDRLKFYDNIIAPYKGELEQWYVANQGISTYMKLIVLTVWVVLFSKSRVYQRVFSNLPTVSKELKGYL
ncbi:sugar transferase [Sulfurovum sp. bin170]|uniref:sugar transferase n=1 Tax=Sulfurovum sp. bin170 TaxID=2695268 RepID=UPI0013E0B91A|nr:sugar transferase [Sulfurovum sp. bin170]NEW60636.1 sugar transferase [Sulfurovum sp. bin170]